MAKRMDDKDIQSDWMLYTKGTDYKTRIDLFNTVNRNNRFVSGDQWNGVVSNGLPTPVFNVLKRVMGYKVASIMQNDTKIKYRMETGTPQQKQAVELLNKLAANSWEKLKMEASAEHILRDGFIQGDGVMYFYWDAEADTGQMFGNEPILGAIRAEEIDNVSVFPGDCNNPIINTADGPVQPYIMLVFRKMVSDVREEAKKNGASKADIEKIVADDDSEYTAGDKGKQELETPGEREDGKCNVILKMWRNYDTGTIWARKCTKFVTVKADWDTGQRLYPVALMNWEPVKNSFHGASDVTGMIPNQMIINKLYAMLSYAQMFLSYGKLAYDRTRIAGVPSNQIGTAVAVNGPVNGAISFLSPGAIPNEAFRFVDTVIQQTKDMMGANETALGDTSVTRTASGIAALQQAAAVPLASVQRRYWQFIEDVALIWLDLWQTYMTLPRMVVYEEKGGGENGGVLDMNLLKGANMSVAVDVGPSTRWSEIATVQTLDNLFSQGKISDIEYFERIPSAHVPDKEGLIATRKQMMAQQQAMQQQQMMQQQADQQAMQAAPQITPDAIMAQLSPEEQEQLKANPEILDSVLGGK